jgi:sulfofructose kinase
MSRFVIDRIGYPLNGFPPPEVAARLGAGACVCVGIVWHHVEWRQADDESFRAGTSAAERDAHKVTFVWRGAARETTYDVVGLGASAIDELLWVGSFPQADSKIPVLRRARRCGGVGATSLVAAARLGSRTAYAGVLGTGENSQFVIDALGAKGVDTRYVHSYPGAGPVLSVILLDESHKTRTILYDVGGMVGPEDDWLPSDLVANARVLLLDYLRIDLMIRAAGFARDSGTAAVVDLEDASVPRVGELVDLVDHLVVSSSFAAGITGKQSPAEAVGCLAVVPGRSVVVTCGADGAWYMPEDGSGRPVHQPAFAVNAVDTNGCGDVFHGAYASALARGLPLHERVRFASAVAAVAATNAGGQEGIPDLETVNRFLEERI